MSDLRIENSNYVVYVLQRNQEVAIKMDRAPEGWDNDALEIIRNKKYHGILTQFTDALTFRGREKDFINEAFRLDGNNANLYLIRYQLRAGHSYILGEDINEVKFREQYRGIADFDTKKEKDGGLTINFNSQDLEKLVESYQSDDLSLGRENDLENNRISNHNKNEVKIKGRNLVASGWAENVEDIVRDAAYFNANNAMFTIPTQFGVKGFDRHVEVTNILFKPNSSLDHQANFFYNDLEDSVNLENKLKIKLKFKVKIDAFRRPGDKPKITPMLRRYEFDEEDEVYHFIQNDWVGQTFNHDTWHSFEGDIIEYDYGVLNNRSGLALAFFMTEFEPPVQNVSFQPTCYVEEYKISLNETSRFETQEKYKFNFVNEVGERLMEIITGKQKKFYSKAFGRENQKRQHYKYQENGEWGHIGLIHGFDIRRFTAANPLYKEMEVSLKSLMDSLVATFNIGVGIEDSKDGQRVRFEKINHFYQGRRIVKLPYQVTNVERSVDAKMFNSSGSFGSSKGGDYEHGLGLDEPNSKTDYIFPLRKTSNKYDVISDIRSDDTGMELIRRQPEYLDDTRDTSGDSHIWYLDLKEGADGVYEQLDWNDALKNEPFGISSPETYRSWRFTPKRSMFRHGSIIRGGMEQIRNLERYITLGSSKANVNLETEYLDGVAPSEKRGIVSEASPEKAIRLDNAIMTPDVIKFKHPVDDDLMDWLLGTTRVMVNGEYEDIPNWYFRVEFLNENEQKESGYIVSMKPKTGDFEMYKANESLLGSQDEVVEELCFTTNAVFDKPITFKVGGSGYIEWNDGTPNTYYNGNEVEIEKYTETLYNGSIKFYGTLKLLYIEDENTNFTHGIDFFPEELVRYINHSANLCTGDVANLPRFMEIFQLSGFNTVYGNVSDIPNGLIQLSITGSNEITGSISDAQGLMYLGLWIVTGQNTINNYTSGSTFNPEIYNFVHKPKSGYGLSSGEVDNILIDLYNSGMQWGLIDLRGSNGARTSLSDQAVIDLENRGVQVYTN